MEQLGFGCQWTDFREICYLSIFQKSVNKLQVSLKLDKNKGYLHEDKYSFVIVSRPFLLRMRKISGRNCRENQNTHFIFSNPFFFFENRPVYEIMWKNIVQPERPQMTV